MGACSLVEPGVSAVPHHLTALQATPLQEVLEGVATQHAELIQAEQAYGSHIKDTQNDNNKHIIIIKRTKRTTTKTHYYNYHH